jgi:hypothetical protein
MVLHTVQTPPGDVLQVNYKLLLVLSRALTRDSPHSFSVAVYCSYFSCSLPCLGACRNNVHTCVFSLLINYGCKFIQVSVCAPNQRVRQFSPLINTCITFMRWKVDCKIRWKGQVTCMGKEMRKTFCSENAVSKRPRGICGLRWNDVTELWCEGVNWIELA